jgi:hypothetical protein
MGLLLLGLIIVSPPCQAQSASVGEAKETASKNLGDYKLTVPTLKDNDNAAGAAAGTPAPSPAPQAGISNLSSRAIARDRNAPRREGLQAFKIVNYLNGVAGGFEQQGAGFGFGLEATTADLIPFVEAYGRALVSTRLYRTGEAGVYINPKGNTKGNVYYNYTRRTQDNFFGIGPRTSDTLLETNYATEQRSIGGILSHKFFKFLEGGLYGRFSNTGSFKSVNTDSSDIVINALFTGNPATADLTRFLPGLNQNVELVTFGGYGELDLRNNDKGLTQGAYFYGRIGSVEGIENGSSNFNDFGWLETELDGRVYIPVLSRKTSVALRAYADLRNPRGGSQIPFYELASIGGRNNLRGFDNLRFRGENLAVFSAELRQTVWTMEEDQGLDLVGWVDGGQVWGDNRNKVNPLLASPLIRQNDRFLDENYRIGAGGGVVYRFNKSTAFRADIGASNEKVQAYFSVSRGF